MNPIELKIKACSLAAEARIIKNIEKRLKRKHHGIKTDRTVAFYNKIRDHRVFQVRLEARATNLARAFLKGLSYSQVEQFTYYIPEDIDKKIQRMVTAYAVEDTRIVLQKFEQWWQDAQKYIKQSKSVDVVNTLEGIVNAASV